MKVATVIQAFGLGLVTAGAALLSVPAGFVVGGLAVVLFGVALERGS
jgi:hypothetical protein